MRRQRLGVFEQILRSPTNVQPHYDPPQIFENLEEQVFINETIRQLESNCELLTIVPSSAELRQTVDLITTIIRKQM